ncbi:MAG TPA: alkaline phosphatase PhoX [Methylomirabilota bacterium]|nr:alkaline phosphatase PhoX [Methylomirabilota bacterium]
MKPSSFSTSTRRTFLKQSALVTTAFAGLRNFFSTAAAGAEVAAGARLESDFYGVLDLPPEFRYHLFSEAGEKMDDGLLVPGKHDGMGAFDAGNGKVILVRNHEMEPGATEFSPFGARRALLRKIDRHKLYDAGRGKKPGLGGTTTLVYDAREQRLERHFLSLAGTYRNCAGGITPWNTWITCEEDTSKPNADGQNSEDEMEKEHGYNFEVPASADLRLADPVPLKAMGRFRHEAVAVDPRTGIVYQTEDRSDGLLFRFLPREPGRLLAGGRLQALKFKDANRADTRNFTERKIKATDKFDVEWVDMQDVESPDDDLRYQGYFDHGAARFARGEGIWYGKDGIYFACTNGGPKRKGQIWRYVPSPAEGTPEERNRPGQLELFIEPNDGTLVENCDNVTLAPWGDLIICEDGMSPQYLVGVTPEGRTYRLAKTTLAEFAGACFSPDGRTLFVNILSPGMTLAITGPWAEFRRTVLA